MPSKVSEQYFDTKSVVATYNEAQKDPKSNARKGAPKPNAEYMYQKWGFDDANNEKDLHTLILCCALPPQAGISLCVGDIVKVLHDRQTTWQNINVDTVKAINTEFKISREKPGIAVYDNIRPIIGHILDDKCFYKAGTCIKASGFSKPKANIQDMRNLEKQFRVELDKIDIAAISIVEEESEDEGPTVPRTSTSGPKATTSTKGKGATGSVVSATDKKAAAVAGQVKAGEVDPKTTRGSSAPKPTLERTASKSTPGSNVPRPSAASSVIKPTPERGASKPASRDSEIKSKAGSSTSKARSQ